MMKKLSFMFVSVLLLLMAACGSSEGSSSVGSGSNASGDQGGTKSKTYNDLLYEVEANVEDGAVTVVMKLTNNSNDDRQIEFSSGQQFDVFIKDPSGETVYHYAEDKMFTQALIMKDLAPDESLVFEDEWEADAAGEYTVEAMLILYAIDGEEVDSDTFKLDFPIVVGE
ncbi:MAG: BsuPI-related putative proteinase inhibitor [Bacillus sp. (in: Bacteria)]|nr:BsuPI-related putative proteinase inhibitor [Bacillus sp. (in: firmicutes)]